ncbi:MAG TPA: IS21 family transposase [Thermotogota bacterium]|nr:IS21 family transposase [Thermotogota bacterium]
MLNQEEVKILRRMKSEGNTNTAIARALNCHPNTVAKRLKTKEEEEMPKKDSKLEAYRDYLKERLKEYPELTAVVLYKEIARQGYTGKMSILRELVSDLRCRGKKPEVLRYETEPGEYFQVDFGQGRTLIGGEKVVIRFFCMILAYSRMIYVRPVPDEQLPTLLESHNKAFEYFGGYPRKGLYDNMRTVITLLERKKEYNKKFMDFADYYGFEVRTHQPYHPQTKGKVERVVPFYRNNCLYGKAYEHLGHLEEATAQWLEEANRRLHSELKEVPLHRFEGEEKNNIIRLQKLYPIRRLETRKVTHDGKVTFQNQLYEIGSSYRGQTVCLVGEGQTLTVYLEDERIATYPMAIEVQKARLSDYEEVIV